MKKTLMTTAVALALGASFGAQGADVDSLTAPVALTANAQGGAGTQGAGSEAKNSAKNSYNAAADDSLNTNISSGFNDVNSHNTTTIEEDGIVAFAQDLNQAVASSDLEHLIGQPAGASTLVGPIAALGGNILVDNSAAGTTGPAALTNTAIGYAHSRVNTLNNGSFNNYGGVASASQNIGNLTEVGQSVVVQSNGGI